MKKTSMKSVNNCNFQSDEHLQKKAFKSHDHFNSYRKYNENPINMEYFDLDHYNTIQPICKERKEEDSSSSLRNINVFDRRPDIYSKDPKEKPNINSCSLGISVSDDEALEDYLSALAKNYDDIDRRIRNAERFVNQIDETKVSDTKLKNEFERFQNYCDPVKRLDEKKMKYVTELRVNIADSIKKDSSFDLQKKHLENDRDTLKPIVGKGRKPDSPQIIQRSSLSKKSTFDELNGIQLANFSSNTPNELAHSRYINSDLDHVVIPPPKSFCSDYLKTDNFVHNKEVQTMDFSRYTHNIFSQSILEDRGIQTMLPILKCMTETANMAVETEEQLFQKISTAEYGKVSNSPESEQSVKSIVNESSDHSLSDEELLKSSNNESIKLKNKHPINFFEKSNNIKKIADSNCHSHSHTKNILVENLKGNKNINKDIHDKVQITSPIKKRKKKKKYSSKNDLIYMTEYQHESQDSKDCAKNASLEITRLLENLNSHLQSRISIKETNKKSLKHRPSTEHSIASFWENPLQKNDLISVKTKSASVNIRQPILDLKKNSKTNNFINSELKAVCKTIEKNIKHDTHSIIVNQSSESENDFIECQKPNVPNLRTESIDTRQSNRNSGFNQTTGLIKKSTSNINLDGDNRFPCNFKIIKSFDLNPYDDIIKSHLSPIDRRLKSVAAKNDCSIVIEGPIKAYDPSISQTFRNKVMYRCTIASASKDNLNKCVNYLKETFPNTFLKTNSRSG